MIKCINRFVVLKCTVLKGTGAERRRVIYTVSMRDRCRQSEAFGGCIANPAKFKTGLVFKSANRAAVGLQFNTIHKNISPKFVIKVV